MGVHVPVGRLSVAECRQIADLADKYCPNGEIRLTVEQNVILPNVKDEDLPSLLAEPALNGDSRLGINPGKIVGNVSIVCVCVEGGNGRSVCLVYFQ